MVEMQNADEKVSNSTKELAPKRCIVIHVFFHVISTLFDMVEFKKFGNLNIL
jgi:hypothetical protein